MSPRDVDTILEALAQVRVEVATLGERLGSHDSHENRIRRLELAVVFIGALVVLLASKALGVVFHPLL